MKYLLIALFISTLSNTVTAQPIDCQVDQIKKSVLVSMQIPHPDNALIHRPDGETVWLQTSPDYIHEQVRDFSNLKTWIINKDSVGTVFVEGKAVVQKVLNGSGDYYLYIADNLETESEGTPNIHCLFVIK